MNRMIVAAMAGVLVAGLFVGVVALGEDKPMAKEGDMSGMGCCPGCGMMMKGEPPKEMMDMAKDMMKEAGITEEMMMRRKAMMMAPMFADDPAALLGMAKGLALTDDQKAKLMDIQKDARAKALAVLTEDQKKTLGTVADKPTCMMDCMKMMHEKMMPVMEKMMKDGKKLPPCCDMMMKCQTMPKPEAKTPAPDAK
jgi:hypothetical protein